MVLDGNQIGDDMNGMILSSQLLEEVLVVIKGGQVQGQFILPSKDGKLKALVSTNADGMFPLHTIKHEGVTYYVGIPKTEADS